VLRTRRLALFTLCKPRQDGVDNEGARGRDPKRCGSDDRPERTFNS
jgi:hypothetical protein